MNLWEVATAWEAVLEFLSLTEEGDVTQVIVHV